MGSKWIGFMAAVVVSGCDAPPTAEVSTAPASATAQTLVQAGSFGAMMNAARAERGLPPLAQNPALTRAALAHARDMSVNGYFSHSGRNGSSFADRARAAGYACPAAENIASGQRSEAEVMASWMTSAGHRRNILLPDAATYGIGQVGTMWVLVLGRSC